MESIIDKTKVERIINLLKIVFVVVPIVAGFDKFTNLLVDWTSYINPLILNILPISGSVFMHIVGVIEISAGIILLVRPKIGAYIVSAWLFSIALSLLTSGHFLDVAVRDLVMSLSAFTFARLTTLVQEKEKTGENEFTSKRAA